MRPAPPRPAPPRPAPPRPRAPRPRPVRLAAAEPARGARATRAAAPPGDAACTRLQSITHYFCGLHPKMKVSCAIAPPRLHSCRTELIALKRRLHFVVARGAVCCVAGGGVWRRGGSMQPPCFINTCKINTAVMQVPGVVRCLRRALGAWCGGG
ncbi:hypothetical protein JYU34_000840 [Plutella xylostella]|uniref:Uncharacterized protein n=1 Tax=Plutella xylostella TaxID=51655 RepID=A0ABQ7R8R7_PLUXY|nr:hypothetical protein JYU34_000840 [Plutella xylostella]